ncbi:carboxymuconolactone decarboxylase family protein [Desulfothermobacter acidiphilus]|uniref:carboxymuconolactone decarboxylase family protein n=1 Tax=Desulfothermobacter acidiphilus TaxID=1938353 RepID=UPI003F8B039E
MQSEISAKLERLGKELPGPMEALGQLHRKIMGDGALTAKQKELIAVGIAVALRCSYCINNHVALAKSLGATRQEILEAVAVAVLMGGGPAAAYATEALSALDQTEGE